MYTIWFVGKSGARLSTELGRIEDARFVWDILESSGLHMLSARP